ncbi:MAG TPA: GAF domain-containing protein, partial [Vulgatibacter sp.]
MTQPHAVPRPAPAGSELPFGQAGGAVAIGSVLLMATFFTLTAGKVGGQAVLWENAHWTVAALAAALLAYLGYRRSQPGERAARGLVVLGLGMYLIGQLAWNLQVVLGIVTVPAVSDVFFLGSAVPIVWGFLHGARARMSAAERTALAIDSVLLLSLTTLIIVAVYAPTALLAGEPLGGAILLLYPIAYIGGAGIAALAGLRLRVGPAWLGINALLGGLAIDGLAWVIWLQQAVTELPPVGSGVNYLFSIATLAMGVGAYRLCLKKPSAARFERFASAVEVYLPGIAAVGALAVIIAVHRAGLVQIEGWIEVGAGVTVALSLVRQSLLLGERRRVAAREHALRNSEHAARARAEEALVAQQVSEKRYRQMVEVFGRLSEQLSFAAEEEVLIRSGVAALRRLVASDSGDVLLANASQDRLVVASAWGATPGDVGEAVGELAPVRCLGIRRGSVYSVSDAADELMLPCPAHPVERGSLLWVPMLALGQTIGVVHLEAAARDAFNADDERQAARVAEQVALAIANARLIKTMESMALTDPLTRLHNARFFDPFLDRELASAQRDGRPLGVILI